MVYQLHLSHVVRALLRARPDVPTSEICERAGLGKNWIGSFLSNGRATFTSAHKMLRAARELCPAGDQGDELRAALNAADKLIAAMPGSTASESAA